MSVSLAIYCPRSHACTTPIAPATPTACAAGSPGSCTVESVKLMGPYSAGRLVIVQNGNLVKRSTERDSCPLGWKIFSPRSREDWKTVYESTDLKLPNKKWPGPKLLVDITRPRDGCGSGCTKYAMNSEVLQQASWVTQDRSPWWLRDDPYKNPSGNYVRDCYMNVQSVSQTGDVKFNDSEFCTHMTRALVYSQPVPFSYLPSLMLCFH